MSRHEGGRALGVPVAAIMTPFPSLALASHPITLVREQLRRRPDRAVIVIGRHHEPLGLIVPERIDPRMSAIGTARDWMQGPTLVLPAHARARVAKDLMEQEDVAHIPVVSSHGSVVGMISRCDLRALRTRRRRLATHVDQNA